MRIQRKVVVVTGASSGIGRATAMLLAEHGALAVLGARREEALIAVVDENKARGGKAMCKVTDVRRRSDLQELVAFAFEQGGKLDVIVNNAGIGPISRFDALRVEDWDATNDLNLRCTLYGMAAALPVFQQQGFGHVINLVSTAGLKILPSMSVYAATKNAVRTISQALRQEAGPHLRVTEISPGMTATGFSSSITDPGVKQAMEQRIIGVAIAPEAIARGIAYAIEQPDDVDVDSIVIRPTAQD